MKRELPPVNLIPRLPFDQLPEIEQMEIQAIQVTFLKIFGSQLVAEQIEKTKN